MRVQPVFGFIFVFIGAVFLALESSSQTCTITAGGNWNNASPPACNEGGNANSPGITIINIPFGITVTFDSNPDTWTGNRIDVYGTLSITAAGQATINSSIVVKNNGLLGINSKLNIGSGSGCGKTLVIEGGGLVDIVGSTPDRLNICGVEIARGGSSGCNPYPAGPLPYCEPSGGFGGPVGFDEDGVNSSLLPVELLFFKAFPLDNKVALTWKTATELNNDYFTLEKSNDGIQYYSIGTVQGFGTTNLAQEYEFIDEQPTNGLSYYRLRQTDFDGTTEVFRPVSIVFEGENQDVVIYPNPVTNNELNISSLNIISNSAVHVMLLDVNGREVFSTQFMTNAFGALEEKVDIQTLPKGPYIFRLMSGLKTHNLKLFIQ